MNTVIGSPIISTTSATAQGTYQLHATPAQLGTPPAGATYLLVVVDPNNTVSPADPSKIASLALPDIAATSLTWDATQGGVDYGYTITNANLPQPTTAALYWAPTATFDSTQDTLIPGSVFTTATAAQTDPYTGNIGAATIGGLRGDRLFFWFLKQLIRTKNKV